MHETSSAFIAVGGNRHPAAADVDALSGLVAFGAGRNIALWHCGDDKAAVTGIKSLLRGHTDVVNAVAFLSLEGSRESVLLSGGADAKIRIWRKLDSSLRFTCCKILEGHEKSINAIAVHSQHGLFVSGAVDSQLKVWRNSLNGNDLRVDLIQTLPLTPKFFPLCLALSSLPASNTVVLAVAGSSSFVQILVSLDRGHEFRLAASLPGHEGWIRSLAFCEDKENSQGPGNDLLLASASQDKYIRLWRLHRGEALPAVAKATSDPPMGTLGAALSNKAHRFETADSKYSITFEALLLGHEDWIYNARWDESGDTLRLLSASADNSLAIWQPDSASGIWTCTVRLGEISAQKGATTATGSTGGFWIGLWYDKGRAVLSLGRTGSWRLWIHDEEHDAWTQKPAITGHTREVVDLAWTSGGSYLISTSTDQTSRLFACVNNGSSPAWHEFARPQIHGYDLNCIDTINNSQFISGADEKLLRVFNMPKAVADLLSKACAIEQTANGPLPEAANIPVLGLSNKAISVHDDGNEDVNGDIQEPSETEIKSSADRFSIDLGEPPLEDHLARHLLWPETEKLYGHGYEISAVAASKDGSIVATACRASSLDHAVIRIFRTIDWREVKPPLSGHSLTITRLRFSPDDAFLLSIGRDRQCILFARNAKGSAMYTMVVSDPKAHTRMLLDASWAPLDAGSVFATAGRDRNVHVWKFSAGQLTKCFSISAPSPVTAVAFLSKAVKGQLVFACGLDDGTVFLRKVASESLSLNEHTVYLDPYLLPSMSVTQLAWRPQEAVSSDDQAQLAIASEDSSVRILNIDILRALEGA